MAKRGQLTPTIQGMAVEFLGRKISQQELRLMPYLHYLACNGEDLDARKVNGEDADVINTLHEEGHLTLYPCRVTVTEAFFNYMNTLIWLAYVDYENQEESP